MMISGTSKSFPKKFRTIDAFLPLDGGNYQLLPFRFRRLQESVILTNIAGEHAILPSDTFKLFVEKKLEDNDQYYPELVSKHFLIKSNNQCALDLLALKLRTKHARIAEFTNLHIFVVTLRCDYSCPYCQVSRQTTDKSKFDMSKETADKSLSLVFNSPARSLKIEFQGGEPLLNFELIKYIVERAQEINKTECRDLQFVIADLPPKTKPLAV